MKTLALTLILALAATQAHAWGVYRGYQARVFYHNPYASRGVFIAGAGHPSSPQYRRGYRGSYGRYRGYGGGMAMRRGYDEVTPADMIRSQMQASDIATELYLWSPIGK